MLNDLAISLEAERLAQLKEYGILDTPYEKDFDDLVTLASQICETPVSLISLVDKDRVWFKATKGMAAQEGPRDIAVCSTTIQTPDPLVVGDLAADERFRNNPLVVEAPHVRFYAGIPLVSANGFRLGALCVIDFKPKNLSKQQLDALEIISRQVMTLINMRLNIKQLKRVRHQVLAGETRFKALAQGAPIGIFQTDSDGIGIYVNEKWCEIVSVTESEVYDRKWIAAIHQDDRQPFLTAWTRAFTKRTNFDFDFRFMNDVKGLRWVRSHASPLFDEGRFAGFVGTLEDITSQKLTEVRLAESEKLFNLIASNTKDLITIFDADENARCRYVSPSCREILGYEPEMLIGLSPFQMMSDDDARLIKDSYLPQILAGKSTRTESRLRKADGSFVWVEALSKPIYDQDGSIKTFQASVRDISERKDFEERLKQEKERAEESTRAKSFFLSTMSHEIRTPMNAVIGLTNLLLQENPRQDQLESLSLLKFSGENLLELINDILDYNKIEAGKLELNHISFRVTDMLTKHVELFRERATRKRIGLNLEIGRDFPPIIMGDPVRLGQVINNLVGNAIKFTEKGSVTVSANLVKRNFNQVRIRFSVCDTGIGIPASNLETIFENFSQGGVDITRKFGGTGLGLSISKKLLHLMGSQISVQSVFGKGAEFSFELNCVAAEPAAVAPRGAAPVMDLPKLRILVVEDNKVNQLVVANFLTRWGMKVSFANNGLEALESVQSKAFDLILMDLQMPEMDGYEATRTIRQMDDEYFRRIPILALTASVLPEIKARAAESGFDDFITKPFQPEELKEKIRQHDPDPLAVA